MSKKKIVIISISSVLALILIAVGIMAGLILGKGTVNNVEFSEFYSEWQDYIIDEAGLQDVVMPGSHDAGSNGMMAPAITQSHNIDEQLEGGVRYFDIRVLEKKDELVIFHGPITGMTFDIVLDEIVAFLLVNPTQFLILDMQHLGSGANIKVLEAMTTKLDMTKALTKSNYPDISKVTMEDVRLDGCNFVIVWPNETEAAAKDFLYDRKTHLNSFYDGDEHKKGSEHLITQLDNYYNAFEPQALRVLQSVRTSHSIFVTPRDMEDELVPIINAFVKETIPANALYLERTNIIMRDFVISDKANITSILQLNVTKNLVKSSMLAEYTAQLK